MQVCEIFIVCKPARTYSTNKIHAQVSSFMVHVHCIYDLTMILLLQSWGLFRAILCIIYMYMYMYMYLHVCCMHTCRSIKSAGKYHIKKEIKTSLQPVSKVWQHINYVLTHICVSIHSMLVHVCCQIQSLLSWVICTLRHWWLLNGNMLNK